MTVDGDRSGRAAAELVVEDLEGQIAVIAGGGDRAHEIEHWKIALARHVAVVAAPVEQIHVDQRRVCQLDDEDLFPGDRADRVDIDLAGQRMEAVEDEADIGVIGAPDNLPGVAMVMDVPAPGERLIADTQAAFCGAFTEFMEIRCGAVEPAKGNRRHIGADQHQIGAEFLHHVELALGPVEGTRSLRLGHAFKITKRLEQCDLQAMIAHHRADVAGAAIKGEKVVLEYLDTGKSRPRDRVELLRQFTTERYRRYRGFHHASPPTPERARMLRAS